jgi:hypothetical protein
VTIALERKVTWGEALVLQVHKSRVGLSPLVKEIQAIVGAWIGTRTTFAKLYEVTDVREMDDTERLRGWLLLTALGCKPQRWGLSDDAVPPAMDVERLRELLRRPDPRTRAHAGGRASTTTVSPIRGDSPHTSQDPRSDTRRYSPSEMAAA